MGIRCALCGSVSQMDNNQLCRAAHVLSLTYFIGNVLESYTKVDHLLPYIKDASALR